MYGLRNLKKIAKQKHLQAEQKPTARIRLKIESGEVKSQELVALQC